MKSRKKAHHLQMSQEEAEDIKALFEKYQLFSLEKSSHHDVLAFGSRAGSIFKRCLIYPMSPIESDWVEGTHVRNPVIVIKELYYFHWYLIRKCAH